MKITVTAIDPDTAVLVRGTSALGWTGKFGCPLVIGDAVFIPARGFEHNLRVGNSIAVDTSFDEVDDVAIVAADAPDAMVALESAGDYEVIGEVMHAAPEGNVVVSVRGLQFTLERKDLRALVVELGQRLRFNVRRLVFWDKVK
jgi:hypothetical protein